MTHECRKKYNREGRNINQALCLDAGSGWLRRASNELCGGCRHYRYRAFFNEEKYIEQCIQSIVSQDYDKARYEIIFVDNNSTDSSAGIVRKHPEIALLEEKKPNVYAARNRAIREARGGIVAFTDADCVVGRDWLTEIDHAINGEGADIVFGKRHFSATASYFSRFFEEYENAKIEYVLKYLPKECFFWFTNNMAVTKDVLASVGNFWEGSKTVGDSDLGVRFAARNPGAKIVFSEKPAIEHLEIVTTADWLKK